jgi:hypothetical protein
VKNYDNLITGGRTAFTEGALGISFLTTNIPMSSQNTLASHSVEANARSKM